MLLFIDKETLFITDTLSQRIHYIYIVGDIICNHKFLKIFNIPSVTNRNTVSILLSPLLQDKDLYRTYR